MGGEGQVWGAAGEGQVWVAAGGGSSGDRWGWRQVTGTRRFCREGESRRDRNEEAQIIGGKGEKGAYKS